MNAGTETPPVTAADWAAWEDEMARAPRLCQGLFDAPCDQAAVVRVWWNWPCGHGPDRQLLCAVHRAELAARAQAGHFITCRVCQGVVTVVRIEPLG